MERAAKFSRYRAIVSDLAARAIAVPARLDAADPSTSWAAVAALLLLEPLPGNVDVHALTESFAKLAAYGRDRDRRPFADASGHRRPAYHPLVLHLHLAAFARHYEALPLNVWSACEHALPDALQPSRMVEDFADAPPPLPQTDAVLWHALCLYEQGRLVGRDVDVELAEGVVHAIAQRAGDDGALHPRDPDESLDAWTYRELVGLHALADIALQARNRAWSRRVEEVAVHHLQNTQPDNTTTQPWAVFAFAWPGQTASFAEQQMHDASTQSSPDGVSGLLLADAANAFAAFD